MELSKLRRILSRHKYIILGLLLVSVTAYGAKYFATDVDITGNLIISGTVDGRDVSADGSVIDSISSNGVDNLTSAEVTQLGNIDSVTLSNTQWGYLGSSDQGISTVDSVEFSGFQLTDGNEGTVGECLLTTDVNGNATWDTCPAAFATDVQTATSSTFDLSTAGYATTEFAQFSGNSITLTAGTWVLTGALIFNDPATNGSYTNIRVAWGSANGDNTSTVPATVLSDGNVSSVSGLETLRYLSGSGAPWTSENSFPANSIVVVATGSVTVYLNARVAFSSAGNLNMQVDLTAHELAD